MRLLKLLYDNVPIYRFVAKEQVNEIRTDANIKLLTCAGYKTLGHYKITELKENKNVVVLSNSIEEFDYYIDNEINSIYCNHNAFLNENKYFIMNDINKEYDMVVSSCFSYYKNVHVSKGLDNVLHVGYINGKAEYIPDFGTRANFKNNSVDVKDYNYINNKKYTELLNKSLCGGIFSLKEGACFSSSEYLLCGLPVISTKSLGGRDVFYNNKNHMICDVTVESVTSTFNELKNNITFFDKYEIRKNKLEQMDYFRNSLTDYVKDFIEDNNDISVNYEKLKNILKIYDNSN